jgi:hypothetical protein
MVRKRSGVQSANYVVSPRLLSDHKNPDLGARASGSLSSPPRDRDQRLFDRELEELVGSGS